MKKNNFLYSIFFMGLLIALQTRAVSQQTILPLVFYTPETSLAGGVIWIKNLWPVKEGYNSYLQSYLVYTAQRQTLVDLTPHFYFNQGEQEVSANISYSYYPNKYYGTPSQHLRDPEAEIENNFNISLSGTHNFYSQFYGRLFTQWRDLTIVETKADGLLEQQLKKNGYRSLKSPSLGVGLDWDSRNFPQSPTEGLWVRLQAQKKWVKDQDSARSMSFENMDLDVRIYQSLANNLVLANQLMLGVLSDSEIPFQFLYSIGGTQRLRGYYQGQYTGRWLVMSQNELRGAWTDRRGWSIFVAAAQLGDNQQELAQSSTHVAGGVGVNYLIDPSNRIKLKIDLAVSRENSGVYFVLGESF